MRIIILGPPGAGKGTQGELLAKKFGLPRLSVGAILRRVFKEGGQKGEAVGKYINYGKNVPAKLLFEILTPWFIDKKDDFVIDNLPRNLDQFEEFKKFLNKTGIKIDKVFHLHVRKEEIMKRLINRSKKDLALEKVRYDDNTQLLKTRIEEGYEKDIKTILNYFRKMGVLVEIDGAKSIEKVHQEILDNLNR